MSQEEHSKKRHSSSHPCHSEYADTEVRRTAMMTMDLNNLSQGYHCRVISDRSECTMFIQHTLLRM